MFEALKERKEGSLEQLTCLARGLQDLYSKLSAACRLKNGAGFHTDVEKHLQYVLTNIKIPLSTEIFIYGIILL